VSTDFDENDNFDWKNKECSYQQKVKMSTCRINCWSHKKGNFRFSKIVSEVEVDSNEIEFNLQEISARQAK